MHKNVKLGQFRHIYFLGIGGIGMSALARWFLANGFKVSGYDKTSTTLTTALEREGINIHYEDSIPLIDNEIFENKEATLVVLTPAIPKAHSEWNFFMEKEYLILKRSQVLGLITQDCFTLAVAGTHGKTTTSSMLAYLLKEAGKGVTAFLGGLTQNYQSNFLLSKLPLEESLVVVEADEFDRSFLTLNPNVAIVTSCDPDHLDIYGTKKEVELAFSEFISRVKREGNLFIKNSLSLRFETKSNVQVKTYGNAGGDFFVQNIQNTGLGYTFELKEGFASHGTFHLNMPGLHNVENAVAALVAAHQVGVSYDELRKIIPGFKGVKRRFEVIIDTPELVFVDDYAHHPAELDALIGSLKNLFPDKKITVIFQPHLFTRTRDFALEFANALSQIDNLLLLDIYPARETPIAGISSKSILERVDLIDKRIVSKEALLDLLKTESVEVLATVGAGDIDQLVQPIKEIFELKLAQQP